MGRDKGMFQAEGIDLQMVLVASTIQVTALTTGDIDFSGAQSQVMAGAARGLARESRWISHDKTFFLADGEARDQVHG